MATLADLQVKVGVDSRGVSTGSREVESKFSRLWDTVKNGAIVAGAAIGGAVMASLVKAMDTEAAVDKLAASLDASAQDAERFGQVAGDLYADAWGESMSDVTNAIGAVISSVDGMRSATNSDLEAMTAKALTLADTFEIDVARAAQVAGQAVRSGLARDATQSMDLLAAALARVPANVREDLLDALDEYGPFLTSIGVTGSRAFALLVAGAQKGMYGIDKTGDALKEFTIRATDMSTASKVGFDILGLSQEKLAKQLLTGGVTATRAFDQIIAGLRGIKDPVQQSQAALALFGTPLEDLNVSEIPKFLDMLAKSQLGLEGVEGAADRMSQTLGDNASTKLTAFKRTVEQGVTNALVGLLDRLQAFVRDPQIQAWWADLQVRMRTIADEWLPRLKTAWEGLVKAFVENKEEILTVLSIVGKVLGFLVTQGISQLGAFIAYLGFVVRAVTGVKTAVGSAVDWITGKWNAFIGFFRRLPGAVGAAAAAMGNSISSPLKAAFNSIAGFWNATVGKLSFTIPSWVPNIGGRGFNMPDIPRLADGAIVRARPGGVLARIAEGGRDEAVVPLPRGVASAGLGGGSSSAELKLDPRSAGSGLERMFLSWLQGALRTNGLKIVSANG